MKNITSLHNLKVLITRPRQQAQHLGAKISAQGGTPILFPTIEIVPTEDKSVLQQTLQHLTDYDLAIFTSANAVTPVMPYWPAVASTLKVIAIGPATAKALSSLPNTIEWPASKHPNSEALLNLPALQQVQKKRIIIFSGVGGRTLIGHTLRQRGAEVSKIDVYQHILPRVNIANHLKQWQKNGLDIIVSTSNESLRNLFTLVGSEGRTWLLPKPLLVISQRMLTYTQELGFINQPLLAENASDKAILTALKAWYASRFC